LRKPNKAFILFLFKLFPPCYEPLSALWAKKAAGENSCGIFTYRQGPQFSALARNRSELLAPARPDISQIFIIDEDFCFIMEVNDHCSGLLSS